MAVIFYKKHLKLTTAKIITTTRLLVPKGTNPIIHSIDQEHIHLILTQLDTQWFIQTEPGSSGKQTSTQTKSSREIFGVTNNGGTNIQ